MLINPMEGTLSQYIQISNHHAVYFTYLPILFIHDTSIKLEK